MNALLRQSAVAAACALSFAAAHADIYDLNQSFAFPNNVSYGTVELTQNGANSADITVTLASGFEFVQTGNHDAFTFNIVGASGYTVTGIDPSAYVWGQPGANPAFGSFTDKLDCLSCQNGGAGAFASQMMFTVTDLDGLTVANFQKNASGYMFSADIVGQGITGAVAAVPEPETYGLMLAGLAAVGFVARRRRPAA
jgi:hypothetical protein